MLRDLWQMLSKINGCNRLGFLQAAISQFFFCDPWVWLLFKLSQDCYIRCEFNIIRVSLFHNLNAFHISYNLVFAFFHFRSLVVWKTWNQSPFGPTCLNFLAENFFSGPLLSLLLLFGKVWDVSVYSVDHSVTKLLIPVKNCLFAALGLNIVETHQINFISLGEITFAFLKEEGPEEIGLCSLNSNIIYV